MHNFPWNEEVPFAKRPPALPVVYALKKGSDICYIGQTRCLSTRWLVHRKNRNYANCTSLCFVVCGTKPDRLQLEQQLISEFRPKLNVHHVGHLDTVPLRTVRISNALWRHLKAQQHDAVRAGREEPTFTQLLDAMFMPEAARA